MEKQIVITAELFGAALVPCTASARERAAAAANADLFGAAVDPRPRGLWTVPLR